MINNVQIIPAILAFSEEEYQKKVEIVNNAPELAEGIVQIDLTDGEFTPQKSIGIDIFAKYPLNLDMEVHLMVKSPLDWIEKLAQLKVKRIIVSLESEQVKGALQKIHELGLEAGLGINPETLVGKIAPYVDQINTLLILAVNPGLGGQEFIPETLDKIKQATSFKNQHEFKIEVDGGITLENIKSVVDLGADGIVIGERLIYGNIESTLENIWEELNG